MFRSLRPAVLSLAVLIVCTPALPASASGCADVVNRRVILAADAVDPNVFVWDDRERMIDYAAGFWSSTRGVLDHTLLEKPGTRAIVISCSANVVHPRYSYPNQDAIGLKLVSGPNRGRYGWAVEEDVHSTH